MKTKAEAEAELRRVMDKYGFRDTDRGHEDTLRCWCLPERQCAQCRQGVCSCNAGFIAVHRRSS